MALTTSRPCVTVCLQVGGKGPKSPAYINERTCLGNIGESEKGQIRKNSG